MKAKWSAVTADRRQAVQRFASSTNLSSRGLPDAPLVERLGRRNLNIRPNTNVSGIRAKRLFVLPNGHMAVATNMTQVDEDYRVFNLNSGGWLGEDLRVVGAFTTAELILNREGGLFANNPNEDTRHKGRVLASSIGEEKLVTYDRALHSMPTFFPKNFLVNHNGRIVGANWFSNRVLFYEPGRWTWDFSLPGMPNITRVGGETPACRGLVSYRGSLIYFSANAMYEILGDHASNMRVNVICDDVGCLSAYSIAIVNGSLIWLGREGIYEWNGGVRPRLICEDVSEHVCNLQLFGLYDMPQAISHGNYYYMSIVPFWQAHEDRAVVLIYDTVNRIWHIERYPNHPPVSWAKREGILYSVDRRGNLWEMSSRNSNEVFDWDWELDLESGTKRIKMDLEAEDEASLRGAIEIGGTWHHVHRAENQWLLPFDRIALRRTKFRLTGRGKVKIHGCDVVIGNNGGW